MARNRRVNKSKYSVKALSRMVDASIGDTADGIRVVTPRSKSKMNECRGAWR